MRNISLLVSALAFGLATAPSVHAQENRYDAHEHLKVLDWCVGEWTGEYPGPDGQTLGTSERSVRWIHDREFLQVEIKDVGAEEARVDGFYLWDPIEQTIRLWVIGSAGQWNQGTVEAEEGTIRIRLNGISTDGKPMTGLLTMRQTDPGSMTMQWTDVTIDGQARPDRPVSRLTRK